MTTGKRNDAAVVVEMPIASHVVHASNAAAVQPAVAAVGGEPVVVVAASANTGFVMSTGAGLARLSRIKKRKSFHCF